LLSGLRTSPWDSSRNLPWRGRGDGVPLRPWRGSDCGSRASPPGGLTRCRPPICCSFHSC
jgi:hypothetical protein